MNNKFKVGDRVKCISNEDFDGAPKEGKTYRIVSIDDCGCLGFLLPDFKYSLASTQDSIRAGRPTWWHENYTLCQKKNTPKVAI